MSHPAEYYPTYKTNYHHDISTLPPQLNYDDLVRSLSPMFYKLKPNDFLCHELTPGNVFYSLKNYIGEELLQFLHRCYDLIQLAGTSLARKDPGAPHFTRDYIPQAAFDQLGLPRPSVLDLPRLQGVNPLAVYTTKDNLYDMHSQLQSLAESSVSWILQARNNSVPLGPKSLWCWTDEGGEYTLSELTQPATIEFSVPLDAPRYIPLPDENPSPRLSSTAATSWDMVLHPTMSAYAQHHPEYDVFSGHTLLDNGYIPGEDVLLNLDRYINFGTDQDASSIHEDPMDEQTDFSAQSFDEQMDQISTWASQIDLSDYNSTNSNMDLDHCDGRYCYPATWGCSCYCPDLTPEHSTHSTRFDALDIVMNHEPDTWMSAPYDHHFIDNCTYCMEDEPLGPTNSPATAETDEDDIVVIDIKPLNFEYYRDCDKF